MVNRLDTKFLQKCRDLYTTRGRKYRVLALYWIRDLNIIIKVDEKKNVAVSVMTREESSSAFVKTMADKQLKAQS